VHKTKRKIKVGRKLRAKVEKKPLCPICGEELVKLHYLGVRRIVKERGSPDYIGSFVDDLVDSDGSLNWCESSSGSYVQSGSGSIEET
jgi:hypothetical protein